MQVNTEMYKIEPQQQQERQHAHPGRFPLLPIHHQPGIQRNR